MTKSDHDLLVEIHARCCGCRDKVDRHDCTLYGNGQEGLTTRVATLETVRTITKTYVGWALAIGGIVGALFNGIGLYFLQRMLG